MVSYDVWQSSSKLMTVTVVNGRDKVVCVNRATQREVAEKVGRVLRPSPSKREAAATPKLSQTMVRSAPQADAHLRSTSC